MRKQKHYELYLLTVDLSNAVQGSSSREEHVNNVTFGSSSREEVIINVTFEVSLVRKPSLTLFLAVPLVKNASIMFEIKASQTISHQPIRYCQLALCNVEDR